MKRLFLIIGLVFALAMPGWATNYYVDTASSGGNGTTTATSGATAAFATVAAAQAAVTGDQHGNSLLFKRGCVWREAFTVGANGTAGGQFTIGDYGSGAKPIFDGSDVVTGWTGPESVVGGSTDYGDSTLGGGTNYLGANQIWYFRVTVSQNCTGTSLSHGFSALGKPSIGTVKMALYRDNGNTPQGGALVAYTEEKNWSGIRADVFTSFNFVSPSATPSLTAGDYWIAINSTQTFTSTQTTWTSGAKYSYGGTDTYGAWESTGRSTTTGSYTDLDAYLTVDLGANYNIYYKTIAAPNQVFQDGSRLVKVANKADLGVGKWWWDNPNGRVYVRCTDDGAPSTHTMELGKRVNCITAGHKNYLTFSNLDCRKSDGRGLYLGTTHCNNVTATYCDFTNNFNYGFESETYSGTVDTYQVDHCTASYNGADGIFLAYLTGSTVEYNTTHHNCLFTDVAWSGGLRFFGPTTSVNVIIQHNVSYSNGVSTAGQGSGIWCDSVGTGYVLRYNLVYNNLENGIFMENTSESQVYYNIVYGNLQYSIWWGGGIFISTSDASNSTGNQVYNNVVYGNRLGISIWGIYTGHSNSTTNNLIKNNISFGNTACQLSCRYGGENDGTQGSGNVYLNNCLGVPSAGAFVEWAPSTFKDSVSAFNTAYGSSTATLGVDPVVVSTITPDFRLQPNSPCINRGATITGLTRDYAGKVVPSGGAADIGAYEYQSGGHWY